MSCPGSVDQLILEQERLALARPPAWQPPNHLYPIGGCFLCFPKGQSGYGAKGDRAWAGAALITNDDQVVATVVNGAAGACYEAGLLALREGPLLEAAVRSLPRMPDLLLVNATGRDHPRRAGLALHLGALLDIPTVGVTHRPLVAEGDWPESERGEHTPLLLDGDLVGYWLCTRSGTRPLAVHAAWRTDAEIARELVLAATQTKIRTPEPVRQARCAARTARSAAQEASRR